MERSIQKVPSWGWYLPAYIYPVPSVVDLCLLGVGSWLQKLCALHLQSLVSHHLAYRLKTRQHFLDHSLDSL